MYFESNKYYVKLYLKNRKVNGMDGIVGFQQDPKDNKFLFTGHFDLNLQNIAGRGKSVSLNWKKTDRNSQFMDFKYKHLSLMRTKINTAVNYNLFKAGHKLY